MPDHNTVEELLEAKEGENIQFKEAKNLFCEGKTNNARWHTID